MRQVNQEEQGSTTQQLEELNNKSLADREALMQLLDRLYTNEINRINHLRNRVLRELWEPCTTLEEWKQKTRKQPNKKEYREEAKMLE